MKLITIKARKDFVSIQNSPEKKINTQSTFILCKSTPNKNTTKRYRLKDFSRFGITATKKISKKAVIRNKIKRRIREILRTLSKTTNIFKNHKDYEIISKKNLLNTNYKNLFEEIKSSIEKL